MPINFKTQLCVWIGVHVCVCVCVRARPRVSRTYTPENINLRQFPQEKSIPRANYRISFTHLENIFIRYRILKWNQRYHRILICSCYLMFLFERWLTEAIFTLTVTIVHDPRLAHSTQPSGTSYLMFYVVSNPETKSSSPRFWLAKQTTSTWQVQGHQ